MADKLSALDVAGGITDILGKAFSTGYNVFTNERDFKYQKDLQNLIFNREDNAVQRRAADLEAAGINKNLAAGSPAGAGTVVSRSNTPNVDTGSALDTISHINQIKAQKNDLDIQEKQKEYIDQQIKYQRFANNQLDFNNTLNQMLMLQGLGFNILPWVPYNDGQYDGLHYEIGGKFQNRSSDNFGYFLPSGTNIYFLENEMNARNLINSAAMLQWDRDFYGANKTFKNIVFPTLNAAIGGVQAGAKLYGVTH